MRLTSLDVFRGITIAGMILVNMAGVADPKVYPPLLHADWHGCTPTDLVFPFFLFIVGVAMTFSLSKYTDKNKPTSTIYWRIFRRAAILFFLGLLLNGFWNKGPWTFDLGSIRLMGVLQRISLTYFFSSVIVLNVPRKAQWVLAGLLLLGYWLTMMYIPVPEFGAGDLTTRFGNFGAYIDRLIIPKEHLYKGDGFKFMGDPEGLFGTIPAIVSVLFGYFSGQWLLTQPVKTRTSIGFILAGIAFFILGWLMNGIFPINKKLWTSSYVLFTTGLALLFLAACYELIEVRQIKNWAKKFEILGLNAIAIFVASVLLIKVLVRLKVGTGEDAPNLFDWIYKNIFASWSGEMNGSLLFALVTVAFWLFVAFIMYRQRWFIKV
jgi:predicted acyltransferase